MCGDLCLYYAPSLWSTRTKSYQGGKVAVLQQRVKAEHPPPIQVLSDSAEHFTMQTEFSQTMFSIHIGSSVMTRGVMNTR